MPSEITTAAELDALPVDSVIVNGTGTPYAKGPQGWVTATSRRTQAAMMLEPWFTPQPLTVVHRPDRPAQPTAQPTVEEVARALADEADDGCFDRIDEWEAREDWEREVYPDDSPASDYEDATYWTRLASRLFTGGLIGGRTEQEVIDSFLTRLGEAVAQLSGDQRLIERAAAIRGEQP